jgi:hypothetical protein
MGLTYFALGALSIVAVIFVMVIVIGTNKIFRLEKKVEDFQTQYGNDLERSYRNLDEFRQNIYRDMDVRIGGLYRNMDEQIKESKKYTDKRIDKSLN